ncbi:hypothetical protein GCM10010885_05630 [Alicyclobacillus cellulosilyticus]|uniref:HTH marR-type domain-containing protein n=1 Tax=Alicyclobacillus cellulosilyticus TaxID=1003997 RepID=A0A917K684_9BACL|nr:MarR family transcriptional regulator [Alicyclobacillus cellulosilyticus]GGI99019.1 hypothetical protein GCM10010885_05630 [Alicyclobacillus cellulosilyticus]
MDAGERTDAWDRIAAEVSDLLPLLAVKLLRFVRDLPGRGMSVAQAFLLHNLRRHGPCTATEIGEMMGITSGPVTNLTKRLIARGWVERYPDARDRRVMWFRLTPAGERVAEALRQRSQARWREIAMHLGEPDAAAAVHLMHRTILVLDHIASGRPEGGNELV